MEKGLTYEGWFGIVLYALVIHLHFQKALERYRSGHNEAVLKTVCPKGRMGSNPILSAV